MNERVCVFLITTVFSALTVWDVPAKGGEMRIRSELENRVGDIKGAEQNVITKRDVAIDLCNMLRSLQPTPEDVSLITKYLTLADPRQLTGRLNSPTNIFPAVTLLISFQEVGATAALDAVKIEHINPVQVARNVAFVVGRTIGPADGLARVRQQAARESYTEGELRILKEVEEILVHLLATRTVRNGPNREQND